MKNIAIIFGIILIVSSVSACRTISDYCIKYTPVQTLECAGDGCTQEQQDTVDGNNAVFYEHCL